MSCFLCRLELASRGLCSSCWSQLTWAKGAKTSQAWVSSLLIYEASAVQLLHLFKYKSPWLWRKILVNWFRSSYFDLITSAELLIPIAMHRSKVAKRGYNQVAILTHALAKAFNKPYLLEGLIKFRPTKSQTSLTREERLINLEDSFTIRKKRSMINKKILLIDDVITTGATLLEAKRVLQPLASDIKALTIATTRNDLGS